MTWSKCGCAKQWGTRWSADSGREQRPAFDMPHVVLLLLAVTLVPTAVTYGPGESVCFRAREHEERLQRFAEADDASCRKDAIAFVTMVRDSETTTKIRMNMNSASCFGPNGWKGCHTMRMWLWLMTKSSDGTEVWIAAQIADSRGPSEAQLSFRNRKLSIRVGEGAGEGIEVTHMYDSLLMIDPEAKYGTGTVRLNNQVFHRFHESGRLLNSSLTEDRWTVHVMLKRTPDSGPEKHLHAQSAGSIFLFPPQQPDTSASLLMLIVVAGVLVLLVIALLVVVALMYRASLPKHRRVSLSE